MLFYFVSRDFYKWLIYKLLSQNIVSRVSFVSHSRETKHLKKTTMARPNLQSLITNLQKVKTTWRKKCLLSYTIPILVNVITV